MLRSHVTQSQLSHTTKNKLACSPQRYLPCCLLTATVGPRGIIHNCCAYL